jgi:hypothetical protein
MIQIEKPVKRKKYFGVFKWGNRYKVYVGVKWDRIKVGIFSDEMEAALAHDSYIRENNLDRRLNFPDPEPENLITNTRLIRLTQGQFAIVDEEDFEYLNQWNWVATKHKHTYYAATTMSLTSSKKIYMHTVITGNIDFITDHKDGNGLHNYKSNLRKCTQQQNLMNMRITLRGTSDFKGVHRQNNKSKYMSTIRINGKQVSLGGFDNEIDAAKAYDCAALKNFGEFARINFPDNA